MSKSFVCVMATLIAWLCSCLPALAINNGLEVPCNDRRFDAVGLFFTASPGGGCGGWISGSCVLIGPDMVLCARHSLGISPTDPIPNAATRSFRVRFRRAADGMAYNALQLNGVTCHGVYQEFAITSFADAPIAGTDLVIGYLAARPIGIHPIPIELNAPPTASREIIICGWGYSGPCMQTGTPWVLRTARGMMPAQGLTDYLSYSPCIVSSVSPCRICPAGGPYVNGNLHDSGGGVFIEVPSGSPDLPPQIRLVGTMVTTSGAKRPSTWNNAQGVPSLVHGVQPSAATVTADFDADGAVTITDLMSYLNAYFTTSCLADVNMDGEVLPADVFTYVAAFFEN